MAMKLYVVLMNAQRDGKNLGTAGAYLAANEDEAVEKAIRNGRTRQWPTEKGFQLHTAMVVQEILKDDLVNNVLPKM